MKTSRGLAILAASFLVTVLGGCMPLVAQGAEAGGTNVVQEVVKLLKAQVNDEVILAYITVKGAPAQISADALIDLKNAGASQAVLLALLGSQGGQAPLAGFPFDLDTEHQVLAPVTHRVMAVFPIERKAPSAVGDYLTLDEALARKQVVIKEKGDGSVPVVIIVNTGEVPIYIAAGEIIIGGKQDRIVAYDVIVKPRAEIQVDVRCVEQGRWHGKVEFGTAGAFGGKGARMAAAFKEQGDVWREVAAQNTQLDAESPTGSYRASLDKPEVQAAAEEYAKQILPKLDGRNIVGMVVAINGKVHAIELFASPSLFARLKDKLLKAYVLDTLGVEDAKAAPPSREAILEFYRSTMTQQAQELKAYDANADRKREGPAAAASECLDGDQHILHQTILSH